jgi:hypothetical protein
LKNIIKHGAVVNFHHDSTDECSVDSSDRHSLLSYSKLVCCGDLISPLPISLSDILIGNDTYTSEDSALPVTGSVVSLAGKVAFPCVCEIAAEVYPMIVDKASCIIADGVRWLSLYLVISAHAFILAEPFAEGSDENGRVLSSCRMQYLQVVEDNPIEVQNASPARRLVFTHTSFSSITSTIPDLFTPSNADGNTTVKSTIDLWFENIKAAQFASYIINSKIERLRSRLGREIFEKIISLKLDGVTESTGQKDDYS